MSYARVAGRLRLPLGFLLGILYLVFARPTPIALYVGGGIALLGLLVRAWAAGHIVKNDRLATTGPYAHTRNPLYFGSFLIAAGFAIAAHWALLALVAVFWLLIYAPTIAREREKIRARFPEQYPTFEQNVPPFFPRLSPWRGPGGEGGGGGGGEGRAAGAYSGALYMRHGEWQAALGYVAAMIWLALRTRGVV